MKCIVEIKPTYKCNQRCPFCLWEKRKNLPSLTPNEMTHIFNYINKNLNPSGIILSGGEPTIRPDFADIIKKISFQRNLEFFHLHTNATRVHMFKEVLSSDIAKYKSVTVGIHGYCSEIHDCIVGTKGAFIKCINGINLLISVGFTVRAVCVISIYNFKYLNEITETLLNEGVSIVEIRLPITGPGQDLAKIMISKEALYEILAKWSHQFKNESRARFIAADAKCFGSSIIDSESADMEYYFFDSSHNNTTYPASSQLEAIWPDAYQTYQKNDKCATCVFEDKCKGFSKEEIELGYAKYTPININNFGIPNFTQ